MRRPPVYLIVILPLLMSGGPVAYFAVAMYAAAHEIPFDAVPQYNGLLVGLPALFLWLPLALLLANGILNAVPLLRRIAEGYVAQAGRPGYWESQRQLLRVFVWSALACIPLITIGWLV
jgi:hypothetical protein